MMLRGFCASVLSFCAAKEVRNRLLPSVVRNVPENVIDFFIFKNIVLNLTAYKNTNFNCKKER